MSTTTNYGLTLPFAGQPLWDLPVNSNFTQIDSILHNIEIKAGNLEDLTTTNKGSLVNAINESKGEITDLETLTTSIQSVLASNDPDIDTIQKIVDYIKINRQNIALKISTADIEDNLTSTDINKPLSANQGRVLNEIIKNLNTLINSINNSYASKTYADSQDASILSSSKAYTDESVNLAIGEAPEALNTLQKIANAINNDPTFYTTITAYIDAKITGDIILQGNYDASTNTPNITTIDTGGKNFAWIVDNEGSQTLNSKVFNLKVNDWIVKTSTGEYSKIDNNQANSSGHTIQNNGTDVPQRTNLNIIGATISDDSTNDKTVITFNTSTIADTTNKRYVTDTEKTAIDTISNKFDKTTDTSDVITEGTTKLFLTSAERAKINSLTNLLTLKGQINVALDFPTSSEVVNGWAYVVKTNVTDNDSSKTNTGMTFSAGDFIAWNGTIWLMIGTSNGSGDMRKEIYDTNANGIVDKAEALSDGTNTITVAQAKTAYDDSHTHSNLTVLNKFTEGVDGKPLYDGTAIGSGAGTLTWSTKVW